MSIEPNDDPKSVLYDARQKFHEEVMKRYRDSHESLILGDLKRSCLSLFGVYNFACGYIREEDSKSLRERLEKLLKEVYSSTSMGNQQWAKQAANKKLKSIEQELILLESDLTRSMKHLLLPEKSDSEDDPNKAVFR